MFNCCFLSSRILLYWQPNNASPRKNNELFQKVCSKRGRIFCNHEVQYANVNVVHIQNRMRRGRKAGPLENVWFHVRNTTSVTWLNSGLLMVHLFLNRSEFRICSQGLVQWLHKVIRDPGSYCLSALPSWPMELFITITKCQVYINVMTAFSAWRQNTKSKIWTGGTSRLSPLGGFLSNLFHQPCWVHHCFLLGGSSTFPGHRESGKMGITGCHCLPNRQGLRS